LGFGFRASERERVKLDKLSGWHDLPSQPIAIALLLLPKVLLVTSPSPSSLLQAVHTRRCPRSAGRWTWNATGHLWCASSLRHWTQSLRLFL